MFSRLLQASVRAGAQRLASAARLVKVSPNVITMVGLALTLVAAVLIGLNLLLPAGLVLLLAGSMDILDGAVARVSGRVHRYGAFLDSTADRYGEGAIYLGMLYLFLVRLHEDPQVFLIAAALLGSLLVSYVRARAQSLGFTCDGGWFARPERVVVTALGLMLGQLTIVLWILAIATNVTAIQRIYLVWGQYRAQLRQESASAEAAEPTPQLPPAKPRRGAAPS
ncbi:MAG TPA: CDP-alcohol phosphatidyltransferase family protein [Candidatus Dormibacteraeota bacterium]|nr:CDP-alcohol phosphatidyltransferase family protein [Candidatus Dormibacteraeota bacterium]